MYSWTVIISYKLQIKVCVLKDYKRSTDITGWDKEGSSWSKSNRIKNWVWSASILHKQV